MRLKCIHIPFILPHISTLNSWKYSFFSEIFRGYFFKRSLKSLMLFIHLIIIIKYFNKYLKVSTVMKHSHTLSTHWSWKRAFLLLFISVKIYKRDYYLSCVNYKTLFTCNGIFYNWKKNQRNNLESYFSASLTTLIRSQFFISANCFSVLFDFLFLLLF